MKRTAPVLAAALAVILTATAASAAAYVKFEGISAEGDAGGHEAGMEIFGFAWGDSRPGEASCSGLERGSSSMREFTVVREIDKASPKLAENLANNKPVGPVTLTIVDVGSGCRVSFEEVKVTVIEQRDRMEEVSFAFRAARFSTTKGD